MKGLPRTSNSEPGEEPDRGPDTDLGCRLLVPDEKRGGYGFLRPGSFKKACEGESADEIKAKMETLQQASHRLAEIIYEQAKTEQAGQAPGAEAAPGPEGAAPEAEEGEEVVDADFEVKQ